MRYQNSWVELIERPDPAAGGDVTFRIPGETFAMVSHAIVQLTTSAVVANRYVSLDILSGDTGLTFRAMGNVAQTASTTVHYSFTPRAGISSNIAGGSVMVPFAASLLAPGFTLRFTAGNLDVGDQFSDVFLYLLRVPSGHSPSATGSIPFEG